MPPTPPSISDCFQQPRAALLKALPARSIAAKARESGVPEVTLRAFLAGSRDSMPLPHLCALAECLGLELVFGLRPRRTSGRKLTT